MLKALIVLFAGVTLCQSCRNQRGLSDSHGEDDLPKTVYADLELSEDEAPPPLRIFRHDLNGDQAEDAVVLLSGPLDCGSGGCLMAVYRKNPQGYTLVSMSTIVKEPIRILPNKSHGWHTLIVNSGGTGNVVMEFDGKRYPSNPSMEAMATKDQINAARELVAEWFGRP